MSTIFLRDYKVSDSYICVTCGQTVNTTLGQHLCPGFRESSSPTWITTTVTGWPTPVKTHPLARPKPKVRD